MVTWDVFSRVTGVVPASGCDADMMRGWGRMEGRSNWFAGVHAARLVWRVVISARQRLDAGGSESACGAFAGGASTAALSWLVLAGGLRI